MDELNQELAWAAYEKYLPAATALPEERVLPYRLDADLAIININQAMPMLDKHNGDIAEHLPKIEAAALESLPSLALALKTAAMQAQQTAPNGISVREMLAEGWRLRGMLLPVLQGLAATGVIPQAAYEQIRRGRGLRDMAEDCVAVSRVFRDYETAVAGKHSIDPQDIVRAESVGSWLLQNLRKRTARRNSNNPNQPEIDIRDRLATLLVESYKKLRAVAYYFYQDDFDDHVPALMSRSVSRRRQTEPAPTPEPEAVAQAAE